MHTVIIGSGVAGVSFAEKLIALSPGAKISLITWEAEGYYSRPLLSRGFTKGDIEQSIILKSFDKLRASQITIISNAEVTQLNRTERSLVVREADQERTLSYDKLILAQGSAAFIPPPYQPYAKLFFCLNSLADLKALRKFRQACTTPEKMPHWAIIGGGLIGCEVASDLAVAGDKVTLLHIMDRLMERQLVAEDSDALLNVLESSGVTVRLNQRIQSLTKQGNQVAIHADDSAVFDGVIVACGFKPRTELAAQAGLAVGRGIKVNAFLQTSDTDIFALGDVAQLPDDKLYAFVLPIRSQAHWLAAFLAGQERNPWVPPHFTTKAKVHGFEATHPYML